MLNKNFGNNQLFKQSFPIVVDSARRPDKSGASVDTSNEQERMPPDR